MVVILGTAFYGAMYPAAVNLLDSLYNTYDRQVLWIPVQVDSATPDQIEAVRAVPHVAEQKGA